MSARLTDKPMLYSIMSGCAWALVGYFLMFLAYGFKSSTWSGVGQSWGGLLAAPLIGLLIGRVARPFMRQSPTSRVAIALLDLFLASWLFWISIGTVRLLSSLFGGPAGDVWRELVQDPIVATLLGLTVTGFVVALWPLSYVNHLLVGRAWEQFEAAESVNGR